MSAPRYAPGTRVRILDLPIRTHMRTPRYVRGKVGTVERYCGPYLNPEDLAFGRTGGPAVHLYQVEFAQADLWQGYPWQGDRLFLEVYEHWLAPAA